MQIASKLTAVDDPNCCCGHLVLKNQHKRQNATSCTTVKRAWALRVGAGLPQRTPSTPTPSLFPQAASHTNTVEPPAGKDMAHKLLHMLAAVWDPKHNNQTVWRTHIQARVTNTLALRQGPEGKS